MKRLVFVFLLFIAACSNAGEVAEPAVLPEEIIEPIVLEPEEVIEPEELTVVEETLPEPAKKEFLRIPDKALTGVSCTDDALTFTITNTADKTWSLDVLSFPPPKDKDQLKISINGDDPWNPGNYFTQASLRDCTDALIEPGDSFSCAVSPIRVVTPSAYTQNNIQVQVTRINEQATFACE